MIEQVTKFKRGSDLEQIMNFVYVDLNSTDLTSTEVEQGRQAVSVHS